jgi:acyl carrier protein phosphodiesterase
MNYLAHAYLSFNDPEILVGNMISDFVKGRKKFDYPGRVQQGMKLHRAIDSFTDDHPVTKEAKKFLKPAVGLYSGAFIDVAYDHFLANDLNQFSNQSLEDFCVKTYNTLHLQQTILPSHFVLMLPYMSSQNWLLNYRNLWGIERSFEGVARRAKFLDESDGAFQLFKRHYTSLQKCYNEFFPLLKQFAARYLEDL